MDGIERNAKKIAKNAHLRKQHRYMHYARTYNLQCVKLMNNLHRFTLVLYNFSEAEN